MAASDAFRFARELESITKLQTTLANLVTPLQFPVGHRHQRCICIHRLGRLEATAQSALELQTAVTSLTQVSNSHALAKVVGGLKVAANVSALQKSLANMAASAVNPLAVQKDFASSMLMADAVSNYRRIGEMLSEQIRFPLAEALKFPRLADLVKTPAFPAHDWDALVSDLGVAGAGLADVVHHEETQSPGDDVWWGFRTSTLWQCRLLVAALSALAALNEGVAVGTGVEPPKEVCGADIVLLGLVAFLLVVLEAQASLSDDE